MDNTLTRPTYFGIRKWKRCVCGCSSPRMQSRNGLVGLWFSLSGFRSFSFALDLPRCVDCSCSVLLFGWFSDGHVHNSDSISRALGSNIFQLRASDLAPRAGLGEASILVFAGHGTPALCPEASIHPDLLHSTRLCPGHPSPSWTFPHPRGRWMPDSIGDGRSLWPPRWSGWTKGCHSKRQTLYALWCSGTQMGGRRSQ